LMGPAGRGSRSTRDGCPRRSRDRCGVRVPERSSQGPDRQRALEAARDRRALEAVPACAFLPHHRHASARWHAAPDRAPDVLGATLKIQVMRMEELRGAAPAFDVLPFSEGSQRGCALVRGEPGALWLVTDDPFSGEQQAWAEERISQEFSWRLVHRGDLVAFLASHEETLRALDAVRAGATVVSEETRGIEDLSLKAISEESSEVVRLVRSTLR